MARRPWALALLASLAAAAVAVIWLAAPEAYPYGSGDIARSGINRLIERDPAVVLLLTSAAVGILLAIMALRDGATRAALRFAGAGAVTQTLFFAFVMSDSSVMSSLGYVVALATPVGVAVVVVVLVCRRWPPVGLVLALLLLVLAVAGFATGTLNTVGESVASYLGGLLSDPEGSYGRVAWSLGMAALAACWGLAAVESLRRVPSGDRTEKAAASGATPASAPRWGRAVTIAAALCPVPYGLIRLTWVTPWPLGGRGIEEFLISRSLTAAERIQGCLFATACAAGVVLTLGLISRWGEVFPRWVPVLCGRAVPVMLAVVPGTLVAAVITLSAPGVLLAPVEDGGPREVAYMLFFFPFPIWGPLLGAAVFAYWLRRTRGPAALLAPRSPGRRGPEAADRP